MSSTEPMSPRSPNAAGRARVITLSASFGAGGGVVGPRLAERFGLPFADRLIPATSLTAPGLGGEHLSQAERQQSARASFLARLGQLTGGMGMPVPTAEDLGTRVQEQVEAS